MTPHLGGVLIPYYVNGLDELPLSEVASGAHDPTGLWPQGFVGGVLQTGGALSMVTMPLILMCVLGGALIAFVWGLPRRGVRRMSLGVAVGLLLVAAACVGALAFDFSPMGTALAAWRMD